MASVLRTICKVQSVPDNERIWLFALLSYLRT